MNKKISEIFMILLGNFILAFTVSQFILPNEILSGGVSSLAILLKPFISIPEEFVIAFIYIVLTIMAACFLGRDFVLKTILSSISYPLFLLAISAVYTPEPMSQPLLAAIFGGLLSGVALGLVFRQDASTGGLDIPPLIVNKYFGFPVSKCVMVTDIGTILLGLWVYGVEAVLIGVISVYISSLAINYVLDMYQRVNAKQVMIISEHYPEMKEAIQNKLERGTTIIQAEGGYTGEKRPIMLCVVPSTEYDEVMAIVNRFDKNAFVIATQTHDVRGEGFSFQMRI